MSTTEINETIQELEIFIESIELDHKQNAISQPKDVKSDMEAIKSAKEQIEELKKLLPNNLVD
tara:strand:- start:3714 stop:3902 length:189 start_codon:yes stop_codon:yes gene_type:complete